MLEVRVLDKREKNDSIVEYTIYDGVKNRVVSSKELKKLLKEGKITISNYKLTKDNRLIRKKDLYFLMNKDKVVGEIELDSNTLNLKSPLVYSIPDIREWLNKRASFSCARNTKEFFRNIGVVSLEHFIDLFHCISLQDTLWVKHCDSRVSWCNVSPYQNNYSTFISNYALEGALCGINNKNYLSPDISTNGSFPHTWKYNNGKILFIKAGSKYTLGGINSGREPYSEYFASKVCEYLGFNHVDYRIREHRRLDGKLDVVTECDCYTSEAIGSISAHSLGLNSYKDIIEYCKSLSETSFNTILDMLFLDCLLLNTDRHFSNIEFLVSNRKQTVIGIAPIYDNNYALLPRFVEELENFVREDYVARDGSSFEEVFNLVSSYKNYSTELRKLRKFKLEKPKRVSISDSRLDFLNSLIQKQVSYLLQYTRG